MTNPFEIIGQLSTTSVDYWDLNEGERGYPAFMVTRAFSYHYDTVMLANEMAFRHYIPARWQYDFYRIAVQPKKKRFAKWAKPDEDKDIALIMETYNVTRRKALTMLPIIGDNIKTLKEMANTGGR